MVNEHDLLVIAGAAQCNRPLAVLSRLLRICVVQFARRTRQLAIHLGDHRKGLGLVEFAGDGEKRVIGLVVFLVKGRQPLHWHVLDIRAAADRAAAIGVEGVGGFEHPLVENSLGAVLAHLELVPHYRHLGVEHRLFHLHAGHPLRLEAEGPFEVLVSGLDRLVVVRAVK